MNFDNLHAKLFYMSEYPKRANKFQCLPLCMIRGTQVPFGYFLSGLYSLFVATALLWGRHLEANYPFPLNDIRVSLMQDVPMNVLYTFSGDPFNVMPSIYSVINNNPDKIIHFYIISPTQETLIENQKLLERVVVPNVTFTYGVSSDHYYRSQKQLFGYNTYLRLHFPIEFPDLERFMYLDGDTLVMKDITHFYYQQFYDKYVIAIRDSRPRYEKKYKGAYFNGGVLVINAIKYRKDKIFEKVINFFNSSKQPVRNRDQSALNYAFGRSKIIAKMEYNYWRWEEQKRAKIYHFYYIHKPQTNVTRVSLVDNLWWCYWDLYNKSIIPWKEDRFVKVCALE